MEASAVPVAILRDASATLSRSLLRMTGLGVAEPAGARKRFHQSTITREANIMPSIFRIATIAALLSLAYTLPAAAQGKSSAPGDNPSDKLNQSRGVIKPGGNIDPKMQVAPPDPGPTSTPVIPPPGSPGGNPNVVPK
jgi:hypothetical protein